MDPVTLASSAVALLSPYLGKAAEKFADAAGQAAWKKAGELYDALKKRLAPHPAASEALSDFESQPQSTSRQGALELALEKLATKDETFAQELAKLIEQAAPPAGVSVQSTIHGNVGQFIQAGNVGTMNVSSPGAQPK